MMSKHGQWICSHTHKNMAKHGMLFTGPWLSMDSLVLWAMGKHGVLFTWPWLSMDSVVQWAIDEHGQCCSWAMAKHGQCWQTENSCLQCYTLSHGKVWTLFIEPWPSIHRLCYAGLWISRDSFVHLVMVKHGQVDIKAESEKSPTASLELLTAIICCCCLLTFLFCVVLVASHYNGARVRVAAAEIPAPGCWKIQNCVQASVLLPGLLVLLECKFSRWGNYQSIICIKHST